MENIFSCFDCEKELMNDEINEYDGKYYCMECFSEQYVFCADCNDVLPKDEAENYDGNYYCEECFYERYTVCVECDEVIKKENARCVDLNDYCEECFHQNYIICVHCDNPSHMDYSYYVDHGEMCCEHCFYEYYTVCDRCSETISRDNAVFLNDGTYCEECAPSGILGYSASVDTHKHFLDGEHDEKLFLGIELEIDEGGENNDHARELLALANKWDYQHIYIKYDGSLDDGFEIVSQPCTYKYHMYKFPWEKILDKAKSLGYRSHDAGTCGLHIHLSREAFGDKLSGEQEMNLMKFVYFMEKHERYFRVFSRRTDSQINRWCSFYGFNHDENDFWRNVRYIGSRYKAVNLNSEKPTIEVRLFRGTLNIETFFATIQMMKYLYDVVMSHSMREIKRMTWEEFYIGIPDDMEHLINYMLRRELMVYQGKLFNVAGQ